MAGIAEHIAKRSSLHRAGRIRDVSIFDTEMRKRLWWEIMLLQTRLAELSGCGPSMMSPLWDANLPLNVNDSDLDPDMTTAPQEAKGATEMIFCLPRYEIAEHLRQVRLSNGVHVGLHEFSSSNVSRTEMVRAIDELEERINEKYLKHCDPQRPLHRLAIGASSFAINKMRYHLHGPGLILGQNSSLSLKELDYLFEISVNMLEEQNRIKSIPSLRKFLWHTSFNKPFVAFIHVLFNLRFRPTGKLADRGWEEVSTLIQNLRNKFSSFSPRKSGTGPLQLAIHNLFVKAWEERERQLRKQAPVTVPPFIEEMRHELALHRSNSSAQRSPAQLENITTQTFKTYDNLGLELSQQPMPMLETNLMLPPEFPESLELNDTDPWGFWNSLMPGSNVTTDFDWEQNVSMYS